MMFTPSKTFHRIWVVGSIFLSFSSLVVVNGFIPRPSCTGRRPATLLNGSSDRAHFERKFEDMMDNDWRAFRAKLVAQEAQGGIPIVTKNNDHHHSSAQHFQQSSSSSSAHTQEDVALQRQKQLGDIFAKSISSIFENGGSHIKKQQQQQATTTAGTTAKRRMLYKDVAAYSGETVSTPNAHKQQQQHHQQQHHQQQYHQQAPFHPHEDPFVSAAELPLFFRETKINKNRWAHEIPHVEPGCVLIANEKLGGVFHQTVVLIVQHCDRSGSIGIVINRPLEGDLFKVATEKKSNLDLSLKLAFSQATVTYGGPVLPEEYSVLHGFGAVEGARKLCPGVFVGGSEDLMNEVRINRMDPQKALFVQGHSAWVPGQLSKEISKGVWYIAAASSNLLLRYAGAPVTEEDNPKDLWADILTCMGGRYSEIARAHTGQGDKRMP